ncbi:hypothetical protein I7I50_03856 [Histoplasma capsulatum G186AR]|uniref:Uncharacterized protein n=1 Tax=Ajellomyces capsulatus TaxID=5037 RepID=A0A8H8CXK5_AJECA|nr:hypothetical protein I7I52_04764 [Histoplasma capsulatum]QSS74899.1 hypothetical protein I7I50_03856 [Histoplasma capsulatum G186AR]
MMLLSPRDPFWRNVTVLSRERSAAHCNSRLMLQEAGKWLNLRKHPWFTAEADGLITFPKSDSTKRSLWYRGMGRTRCN